MKSFTFLIFLIMSITISSFAQPALSGRQQSIVFISAFTANGDQTQLKKVLAVGLDAGITINEIKEVIVQLYAYAGFPRSLNALNTFMAVLNERKQKGIVDPQGKFPNAFPTNKTKLQFGTEMQTKLVGTPVRGEVYEFAPAIDQFLKEHLFGDIFGRDNLDWKTRELATISALAVMDGTDAQLRSHLGVGMRNGITEPELKNVVSMLYDIAGKTKADNTKNILEKLLGRASAVTEAANSITPNMTGKVAVNMLPAPDGTVDTQVGSVAFEPGARTYWHKHPAGQILVVTEGTGYYQEKGKPVRIIRKGDVIQCEAGVIHWHGASSSERMTHIAITRSNASGRVEWMQAVTDGEYFTATL